MTDKSLMIVAGETSGEFYGAKLTEGLKELIPGIKLFGIGGAKMEEAGVELLHRCEDLAVVGLSEALSKLPEVIRAQRKLLNRAKEERPKGIILIDFPDFNLNLARKIKPFKIPIIYYISPQVWAWRPSRIKKIAQLVDKMLIILPFEEEIYREAGVEAEFVGHPLIDFVKADLNREEFCEKYRLLKNKPIISFLPGSREKEVKRLLPPMLQSMPLIKRSIDAYFILQIAEWISRDAFSKLLDSVRQYGEIIIGDTYNVMKNSDLVVLASGTAALEAALLGTPMVVLYRLSKFTYFLGRLMVKIKDISLVNILAGERVVAELLQSQANGKNIAVEVANLWQNPSKKEEMKSCFKAIRDSLGNGGASFRAAQLIAEMIK